MKLIANSANLRKHAKALLGVNYTPEAEVALIKECLTGFIRHHGHISHSRAAHLERIDKLLGTYGVEGMLLDSEGQDQSGTCSMRDVVLDVQYCNAGDTYAMTVMYVNGKLCIGDWGSVVESSCAMSGGAQ